MNVGSLDFIHKKENEEGRVKETKFLSSCGDQQSHYVKKCTYIFLIYVKMVNLMKWF